MRTSLLGRTGVTVSRLALGTMTFGTETDEPAAGAIWRKAREAGINFIDTADVYGDGRAEEIVGRLLRGCRDEIVLATKASYPTGRDANSGGNSRYHLVRAVEGSLARLATDRIDVYYVHRFDDRTALCESLRALDDLVRQGKILYPACSNFAAWQVAHALGLATEHEFAPFCAVQPMYSLLKRQAEQEILPMAESLGIAVVPYSPTAGGLLTGKYGGARRPVGTRFGEYEMYRARYADEANWTAAAAFARLARELGRKPATLAVAWVAAHPAVRSILLGARNVAQLEETLEAADLDLSQEVRARISALTSTPAPVTDRSEERPAQTDSQGVGEVG